jgi:hypothetical protein
MKIKTQQTERKPLRDLYKVGEVLKVNKTFFDGRGYENECYYVTLTKINTVTAYGITEDGDEVILDNTDLRIEGNVRKVLQREILA